MTRMFGRIVRLPVALAVAVFAAVSRPESLLACASCFGKSDSPMAQGMNMGIFTLLVVVLFVLTAIAGFFFYIIRRAARFEAAQGQPTDTSAVEPTAQTTHPI
jgi:hypothetical protein